ncbi:MAG: hypothetical protein KBS59_07865 [Clostridiales bacterium]|nr:hypothetical protein [Clostridiales bacterium]
MNVIAQTLLDAADGGIKYKTEKLPRVKIKQQSPMPSLTMLAVISVTMVLLFCVFSTVQILKVKTDIYKLRRESTEITESIQKLEGLSDSRYARLRSMAENQR